MIELRCTGPLPECVEFPRGRLYIALHKALHPDGGQLAVLTPTDLENRPIGEPLSGRYWPSPPAKKGAKPKPARPIAAVLYQQYLTGYRKMQVGKAENLTAEVMNYGGDSSIRHTLKRGRDKLIEWGAWLSIIGEIDGVATAFVFHKETEVTTEPGTLILAGDCWHWKQSDREASYSRLRIEAAWDNFATPPLLELLKSGSK